MQKWFRLFESIHYWIIEIISFLLDVKNEEVSSSEVEICALARYSSQRQFSALAELQPGNVRFIVRVGPSTLFPGNRALDFDETWSVGRGG